MLNALPPAPLSDEDVQHILHTLRALEQEMPCLKSLSNHERRSLTPYGEQSRGFVEYALLVAQDYPHIIPHNFDVNQFAESLEHFKQMHRILRETQYLMRKLNDTTYLFGSEMMRSALRVYGFAKAAQRQHQGMKTVLEHMGQHFQRKRRSKRPIPKPDHPTI